MSERIFEHCPRCCAPSPTQSADAKRHECAACGWLLFHNTAAAVMAVPLLPDGRVVFARRARDPARGLLDLPGGFIDPGEDAETALARELAEELGIDAPRLHYLGSASNRYPYAGVTYTTCDVIYRCDLDVLPAVADHDELSAVEAHAPEAVAADAIAFRSIHTALALLRADAADRGA